MRDFPLFEKPDINSPKIHQMLKGHKFDTYENYTKTIKLGTGIVAVLPNWAKGKGLKRGDKVTVIRYVGEGWYSIWFNGEILSADLKEIKRPQIERWVQITTLHGKKGWAKQPPLDWDYPCS